MPNPDSEELRNFNERNSMSNTSRNKVVSNYQSTVFKTQLNNRRPFNSLEKIHNGFNHFLKTVLINLKPKIALNRVYDRDNTGIYPIEDDQKPIKFAILSDWASYTQESYNIAQKVNQLNPEYTFNLGDTYFSGNEEEIDTNFNPMYNIWCRGTKGSFSTPGNHDMYSNGSAFFNKLLPWMGIEDSSGISPQATSYFCFENDFWRIICIDSGYHSTGGYNYIPFLSTTTVPDVNFEWLQNIVKVGDDQRGIVLLTHHQYISAFDGEYKRIAKKLKELIGNDREIIWLWGHEHRFAIYGKYRHNSNYVTAYGRCIGNGGMSSTPISQSKLHSDKTKETNLVFVDNRSDASGLGYYGFCMLSVKKENLLLEYYDSISKDPIVTEQWKYDSESQSIKGVLIKKNEQLVHSNLVLYGQLNNAIRP